MRRAEKPHRLPRGQVGDTLPYSRTSPERPLSATAIGGVSEWTSRPTYLCSFIVLVFFLAVGFTATPMRIGATPVAQPRVSGDALIPLPGTQL